MDSLTNEQLSDILLYHVLPGKVMSVAAISLAQTTENMTATASGSSIALSFANVPT